MMHVTQVQVAQIVSSAVSQALTQHIQQIGSNSPLKPAANHVPQNTAAAQQVQSSIKFGVSAFDSDNAAS